MCVWGGGGGGGGGAEGDKREGNMRYLNRWIKYNDPLAI